MGGTRRILSSESFVGNVFDCASVSFAPSFFALFASVAAVLGCVDVDGGDDEGDDDIAA